MSLECQHGHLARKCYTCELEHELETHRAALKRIIRIWLVDDEAWDVDAETEQRYQQEINQ